MAKLRLPDWRDESRRQNFLGSILWMQLLTTDQDSYHEARNMQDRQIRPEARHSPVGA
ncbi:hypothetical protein [Desulfoscipio geothermicus]|uniref:hypothetical protein n=1 Tax=Desulfoscipio geothermicus TaxID=39060 RepID=UPI0013F4EC8F|nr:hypothetical protein [Desulfoscipio geothermicus]